MTDKEIGYLTDCVIVLANIVFLLYCFFRGRAIIRNRMKNFTVSSDGTVAERVTGYCPNTTYCFDIIDA